MRNCVEQQGLNCEKQIQKQGSSLIRPEESCSLRLLNDIYFCIHANAFYYLTLSPLSLSLTFVLFAKPYRKFRQKKRISSRIRKKVFQYSYGVDGFEDVRLTRITGVKRILVGETNLGAENKVGTILIGEKFDSKISVAKRFSMKKIRQQKDAVEKIQCRKDLVVKRFCVTKLVAEKCFRK